MAEGLQSVTPKLPLPVSNEANDVTLPEPADNVLTQVARDIKAYYSPEQPVQPAQSRTLTLPSPELALPAKVSNPQPSVDPVPAGKTKTVLHGMNNLVNDFELSPHEAAGVMGNLAHESEWFTKLQEEKSKYIKPGNKGGYGWAQWTDSEWEPRRTNFLKYAKVNKLHPTSDQANYGFLKTDLSNNPRYIKSIRGADDVNDATERFMNSYEKPNSKVAQLDKRQNRAQAILDLYNKSKSRTQKLASNP